MQRGAKQDRHVLRVSLQRSHRLQPFGADLDPPFQATSMTPQSTQSGRMEVNTCSLLELAIYNADDRNLFRV